MMITWCLANAGGVKMNREAWSLIKQSTQFYKFAYRKMNHVLLISLIINLLLSAAIYYTYLAQTDNTFSATKDVFSSKSVAQLDSPNNSSLPLLVPDSGETRLYRNNRGNHG